MTTQQVGRIRTKEDQMAYINNTITSHLLLALKSRDLLELLPTFPRTDLSPLLDLLPMYMRKHLPQAVTPTTKTPLAPGILPTKPRSTDLRPIVEEVEGESGQTIKPITPTTPP
jgi:hypothetical protein